MRDAAALGKSRHPFIFSPDSQIWRVSRENAILLGGPAAAILQIAHPEVAAGVAAHSRFRTDAIGRLHRTLEAVYTITFATHEEAGRQKARVAAIHQAVEGTRPIPYSASSPDAQLWVLATLIAVGTEIFEEVVAPLSAAQRKEHYRDMRIFGSYFGLPPAYGPQTAAEFHRYYREMLESPQLASLPICREIALAILRPVRPRWLATLVAPMEGLICETIPSPVREKLGFRSSGGTRLARAAITSAIRTTLPLLPASIRFTPRYLAARKLLAAR